jgi:hypothetical protein
MEHVSPASEMSLREVGASAEEIFSVIIDPHILI